MSSYKKKVLEARKKILELTNEQLKQIDEIYAKSANRLIDEILELPDISRTRVHDIDIARLLNEYTKDLYKQLYPNVTENMMESSIIQRQVILDYVDQIAKDRTLSKIVKNNINIYSNKVVKTLIAGEYYKDGKTLSKRLWNITKENGNKIDEFIKMNIASGANARKLANDLETLINPKKRLVTNNFKAGFDSYKISYQAQRLARTSITHAATETQIQNAKKNPFDKGLKWNLSASHGARMHGKTDMCDDNAGKVFKPEDVPLQHPNCLCFMTEEVANIDDAIARINKWVDGGEDKELDKWCEGFDKAKKAESKKSKQAAKIDGKNGTITVKIPKDNNKKISSASNINKIDKKEQYKTLISKRELLKTEYSNIEKKQKEVELEALNTFKDELWNKANSLAKELKSKQAEIDLINKKIKDIKATIEGINKQNKKGKDISKAEIKIMNRDGKEIKFDLGNMKEEKQRKIKDIIARLSNEYNTRLIEVEKNKESSGTKGSVTLDFKMHLSNTQDSTVYHEFAHSLAISKADKLGLTNDKEFWKEIKKIRTQYTKAYQNDRLFKISQYSEESIDEFMAEAFAHAKLKETGMLGSEYGKDFTYSDKVLKIIDKYFKKVV